MKKELNKLKKTDTESKIKSFKERVRK